MIERDWPEFDCCECGRHIVVLGGPVSYPPLCAACLMLPGWFRKPEMRNILDPEHDGRDPADAPQVVQ